MSAEVDQLIADLASTASNKGASLVGNATGGTVATVLAAMRAMGRNVMAPPFNAVADGTNQNTAVQAALNDLGADGGFVLIPRGVKWNPQTITFPVRSNIVGFMDDDLSRPNPTLPVGQYLATNELVIWSANANPSGYVNEVRVTAPFSNGLMIDLRSDVQALGRHDFAGPDQAWDDADVPLRNHFLMGVDQAPFWRIVSERYRHNSTNSVFWETFRQTVVLNGVGTTGWTTAPAPANGTVVEGTKSKARGIVRDISSGSLTLEWLHGKFEKTDKLKPVTISDDAYVLGTASDGEVTNDPGPVVQDTQLSYLAQGSYNGAFCIGHSYPQRATDTLEVTGGLKIVPAGVGQRNPVRATAFPALIFGDSPERQLLSTPDHWQLGLAYDTSKDGPYRRLHTVRVNRPADGGAETHKDVMRAAHMGVDVFCIFSDADMAVQPNWVHVSSVTNTAGSGIYYINFDYALKRPGYLPKLHVLGTRAATTNVEVNIAPGGRNTGFLAVEVHVGGVAADLPPGVSLGVEIVGGDC